MSLMSFTIMIREELYCMINYPVMYCIVSKCLYINSTESIIRKARPQFSMVQKR